MINLYQILRFNYHLPQAANGLAWSHKRLAEELPSEESRTFTTKRLQTNGPTESQQHYIYSTLTKQIKPVLKPTSPTTFSSP